MSELSRRRIRSIQKLIRVGRNEVVVVMRVDKEKGESGRGRGRDEDCVHANAADVVCSGLADRWNVSACLPAYVPSLSFLPPINWATSYLLPRPEPVWLHPPRTIHLELLLPPILCAGVLLLLAPIHLTGYIDLSKRRVSAEDVVKCEERYNKSKAVHSIMRHVAEKTEKDLEEINEMIAWPLYDKFGHAYEAFKLSIT